MAPMQNEEVMVLRRQCMAFEASHLKSISMILYCFPHFKDHLHFVVFFLGEAKQI